MFDLRRDLFAEFTLSPSTVLRVDSAEGLRMIKIILGASRSVMLGAAKHLS